VKTKVIVLLLENVPALLVTQATFVKFLHATLIVDQTVFVCLQVLIHGVQVVVLHLQDKDVFAFQDTLVIIVRSLFVIHVVKMAENVLLIERVTVLQLHGVVPIVIYQYVLDLNQLSQKFVVDMDHVLELTSVRASQVTTDLNVNILCVSHTHQMQTRSALVTEIVLM